jgi:hypothetical protein
MPLFSDLRSDYPLNLTVLERLCTHAVKQSYQAGLTSGRTIPVSLTVSNCWCPSRFLVDRGFDAQHYSGTNCLNIDQQLVHLVEHWCATPRGNNGRYSYALRLSSFCLTRHCMWSPPSTSCPHRDVLRRWPQFFVRRFKCRTRRKECTSGPSLSGVPVRGQQGKSDQLKSDQLKRST